jgi:glucose/arabinose dehydrogenase
MRSLLATTATAVLLAACGGAEGQAQSTTPAPYETRAPNTQLKPALPGQARAPELKANVAYEVTTYAEGLQKPWGIAFLPDGRLLITEKAGRLRIRDQDGKLSEPVTGIPEVDARGQGGLLGLAIDPDFARNGLIYWSFSEPDANQTNHTAVGRGKLVTTGGAPRLENVQVIFRQTPSLASTLHYGGRLVFAPDKTLYVTTGERSILQGRMQAQRLDGDLGKIIRINSDGSIPKDNPFVGREGVRPEIFSIGQRNVQAAALHPVTGKLWEVEHGPLGGDELNIIEAGKDYGWPTITYGLEYNGKPIGDSLTQKAGMEQPVYYWDPVIAPSGMAFYTADLAPAWKGSLFVGALGDRQLVRLTLKGDKVIGEERLLTEEKERIRDVIQGPDGALYLATDNQNGRILRVAPKK